MPAVLFDFDSTLIDCESLDEILARGLAGRPDDAARVREITQAGMEGRIGFRESLEGRLAIARPTRAAVEAFGEEALDRLTPGIAELVRGLAAQSWIVSGALRETLLPVAALLGVPERRIVATRARWGAGGELEGLEECRTKVEAAAALAEPWARPCTAVGDGMTDHALLAAGCVDRFIAFTAHARREAVVATGAPEARTVGELEYLLAAVP